LEGRRDLEGAVASTPSMIGAERHSTPVDDCADRHIDIADDVVVEVRAVEHL